MMNKITRRLMDILIFRSHFPENIFKVRCSLESENEILELQSYFTSFGFIQNVHQASGYLIHHQV